MKHVQVEILFTAYIVVTFYCLKYYKKFDNYIVYGYYMLFLY